MIVIADVCLCEYTDHGHCGLVCGCRILNDETLPLLSAMSVSLAKAGADIIAPSDMMDGRVAAIRKSLDENGFTDTPIMAYSAKFASGYYSPFRDAAHSAPGFGDRKTYQMDPANGREALREIEDDIREGADMVMVKPALAYLDVLKSARERFDLPLVAIQCQRRILDGQGGGADGLDRRAAHSHGKSHGDKACRRGYHHNLPRA